MTTRNPATARHPKYQTLDYEMAAGQEFSLAVNGDFCVCLEADGDLKIGFNNGPKAHFEQGLRFRTPEPFNSIEIENVSGAANTVRLGIGRGQIEDARLNLAGSITSREDVPDVLTSGAAVSCADAATTLLAAANSKRREILATVPASAGGSLHVGGAAGALAGEGLEIAPGATVTLQTTAAVYVRNDTGGAVSVSVIELEFSA